MKKEKHTHKLSFFVFTVKKGWGKNRVNIKRITLQTVTGTLEKIKEKANGLWKSYENSYYKDARIIEIGKEGFELTRNYKFDQNGDIELAPINRIKRNSK